MLCKIELLCATQKFAMLNIEIYYVKHRITMCNIEITMCNIEIGYVQHIEIYYVKHRITMCKIELLCARQKFAMCNIEIYYVKHRITMCKIELLCANRLNIYYVATQNYDVQDRICYVQHRNLLCATQKFAYVEHRNLLC